MCLYVIDEVPERGDFLCHAIVDLAGKALAFFGCCEIPNLIEKLGGVDSDGGVVGDLLHLLQFAFGPSSDLDVQRRRGQRCRRVRSWESVPRTWSGSAPIGDAGAWADFFA